MVINVVLRCNRRFVHLKTWKRRHISPLSSFSSYFVVFFSFSLRIFSALSVWNVAASDETDDRDKYREEYKDNRYYSNLRERTRREGSVKAGQGGVKEENRGREEREERRAADETQRQQLNQDCQAPTTLCLLAAYLNLGGRLMAENHHFPSAALTHNSHFPARVLIYPSLSLVSFLPRPATLVSERPAQGASTLAFRAPHFILAII